MTCTEFQEVLPYIIDSDPTAEDMRISNPAGYAAM
jgi:hypothetical protein